MLGPHSLCVLLSSLLQMTSGASSSSSKHQCGLYLAPSSIPNAGLGVFAGKSYKRHDVVVDGDLAIPLYNMPDETYPIFPWDEYTWGASSIFDHLCLYEDETLTAAVFGMGAAINCMFGLENIVSTMTTADNCGLHRSRDAGVGAFTPYHDRKVHAHVDIPAGMELFGSYGERYFLSRSDKYGYIPFEKNFVTADKIVKKFVNLTENEALWTADTNITSADFFQELWEIISGVKRDFGSKSRVLQALPDSYSSVQHISEIGTALTHYNRSVRALDWLEEHGKCADNIRPGPSTIPQAGRGAFATRFIPKGGLVAPAPLLHIPDRKILDMHEYYDNDEEVVVHQQLLLNYCFGHANSSLLLSPYGVFTSLINHSSQKPNAKVQWSDSQPHPEWMKRSVESLNKYMHAGLAFDFIALRDINEGEEILIDYGSEWEEAWESHVKNWVPSSDSMRYQAGFEMNENLDSILWAHNEYPYYSPNVTVWIHGVYHDYHSGIAGGERDYHEIRIVDHYVSKGKIVYDVEVIDREDDETLEKSKEVVKYVVFGLPRDAVFFEDEPYTRDHQMYTSFRHTMMVPNDMFPDVWKNIA